ncbi:hypothetical protein NG895_05770 [Aeoliella sp. ICT_H6.2]|uniref:Uncharacterized protein n=1 Tax=Aeoliella straminimaris TaxID=2954799 RepID=A0A9X2JGD6_9BACT|nr:hypothetical protein [Aeoliella straminimaris]MCO6043408.1 hypothetical protein [Aeoliella straminimaris]
MDNFYNKISEWFEAFMGGTWNWFNTLSREEWVVVLAVVAACGFLCMRGYGSRSNF